MMSISKKAGELLRQHYDLSIAKRQDYYAGVLYTPDFSYEMDEETYEHSFNQAFHDLILSIGVIDSAQDPDERMEVGQAYIIPTKELEALAKENLDE